MRQLVQSIRYGTTSLHDVPAPQLRGSGVLVQTAASLISAGTERAALEFARGSLFDKARSRPDLVKQVIQKVQRDGVVQAVSAALSRLDTPVAPGYACAGVVIDISPDLQEFEIGDRVACAGAGFATHAEINYVPKNLAVRVPRRAAGDYIGFDEAAFVTLGAIALHGVRLAHPQLGDRAVVIGLGAVGLLAVQLLRAHGCRVAGIDVSTARCDLAQGLGADLAVTPAGAPAAVNAWTQALGADLIIVAAASTDSTPAVLAADLSRDKGRIVAVGATGLDLPRRTLYQKELSVVVSRSYGPGRYDPEYEERGRAYPLPYVRWTERENMLAFLDLVAEGRIDVNRLISHRFPIAEAGRAYETLEREPVLGILLEYPGLGPGGRSARIDTPAAARAPKASGALAAVSVIGAGSFARAVLLPAVRREAAATLRGVIAATGLSAKSAADRFGFAYCSTAANDVWRDAQCNAVMIATRHDTHAHLVIDAINAGKAVFVEKPLCLSENELGAITEAAAARTGPTPFVMVGFNRRFAPATLLIKSHFASVRGPVNLIYRVSAGRVPQGSWVTSEVEGGGRLLGELCHFIDLCGYLAGASISQVSAIRSSAAADDVMVSLRMANGSIATIAYMVDGDPAGPKEWIEVIGGGASATIDDFRRVSLMDRGRVRRHGGRFSRQDKGHRAEVAAFVRAVTDGGPSPVPFESALNTTAATFAVLRSLTSGQPVTIA